MLVVSWVVASVVVLVAMKVAVKVVCLIRYEGKGDVLGKEW